MARYIGPHSEDFEVRVSASGDIEVKHTKFLTKFAVKHGGSPAAWRLMLAVKILVVLELIGLALWLGNSNLTIEAKSQILIVVMVSTVMLDVVILFLYIRWRQAGLVILALLAIIGGSFLAFHSFL